MYVQFGVGCMYVLNLKIYFYDKSLFGMTDRHGQIRPTTNNIQSLDKTIELIDTTKKVLCKRWKDTLAAPDLHKDEPDEGIDDGVGGIFAGLLDPLEGAVVAGEAEVMLRAVYSVPCPTTTSLPLLEDPDTAPAQLGTVQFVKSVP